ncbi:MAG: hypothetical protein JNM13_15775 [Hyphomicrobiaceae bacterium]|nr:hypothetical protein [Hyphomicrobiaceae bacterium]
MFNLDAAPRFPVLVRPAVPGAEDGSLDITLIMSAARSSETAARSRAILEAADTGDIQAVAAAEIADLAPLVHGWRDVVDADGAPVPFSAEALAQLLDLPAVRIGIYRGYGAALREAATKN